jgi:hypothetical protein
MVGLINPLNAKLNPICHLLALVGAHPVFHVSRIRVKHTEPSNHCAKTWTYFVGEQNVQQWRKQNLPILKIAFSTQEKHFISPSREI